MSFRITGDGTPDAPFDYRVRHILKEIIKNPKATAHEINKLLSKCVAGMTGFKRPHLSSGVLSEVIRHRVDLSPRRNQDGIGTSFLEVRLRDKKLPRQEEFEAEVRAVKGVIEWDCVAGDYDYLVRVVGHPGGVLSRSVSDDLERLPSVSRTSVSSIQILRSGVVDNIEPDHFLCIDEDPKDAQADDL